MQQFNDLKNMVLQTLDNNGALSNIRAQIRHTIFKIIDQQQGGKKGSPFFTQNSKVQKLIQSKQGQQHLMLIRELFQFYRMNYALDIFGMESNQKQELKRQKLIQQFGLTGKVDKTKPLLLSILQKYKQIQKKGGATASIQKKQQKGKKVVKKEQQLPQQLQQINLQKNQSWKMGQSQEFGQSRGQDQSVDSLKLQEYDYYQSINQFD